MKEKNLKKLMIVKNYNKNNNNHNKNYWLKINDANPNIIFSINENIQNFLNIFINFK